MSTVRVVRLNDIIDMLADCAAGFSIEEKKHHYWVRYNGLTFQQLPLGKHGRRANVDIEYGHVRSMMRLFEIEECGAKHFKEG